MDQILTEFITRTKADPALAHDLLEATEWQLEAALEAYQGLHDTHAVIPEEQIDFAFESDIHIPDFTPAGDVAALHDNPSEDADGLPQLDERPQREVLRRERRKKARGLIFVAEDVLDKFMKVAVLKERVSSEEQVTIDDKFFRHSFIYPDLSSEPEALQQFIATDLIETAHKLALEKAGRLNWWTSTGKLPRLEPLATSGDGNCLLHAASLYMWGFHDRELILRTALHRLLTTGREREGIRRRWKLQTGIRNEEAVGLKFSDEEWDFEWSEVVKIATNQPRGQPLTESLRRYSSLRVRYESLEEIHVFALAHVLRRPMIVIADKVLRGVGGEDFAPIYFGGIYLPLEISPTLCYKSPVVLAYDASHFSALVAKEEKKPQRQSRYARIGGKRDVVIPLVLPSGSLLPVQFIVDPEKRNVDEKWVKMGYNPGEFAPQITQLLESYLEIRWIQLAEVPISSNPPQSAEPGTNDSDDYDHLFPIQVPKIRFPAALIRQEAQPIYQKELIEKYLENVKERFKEDLERRQRREEERARREEERARWEEEMRLRRPVPCEGVGCSMFGTASTNNLCSVCYQRSQGSGDEDSDRKDGEQGAGEYHVEQAEMNFQENLRLPSYSEAMSHHPYPPHLPPSPKRSISDEQETPRPPYNPPSPSLQARPNPSTHQTQPLKETDTEPPRSEHSLDNAPQPSNNKASPTRKPDSRQSGWRKKLPIPSGIIPGRYKRSNSTEGRRHGYTRDNIQPIGHESPGADMVVAGIRRTRCISAGCKFYGSAELSGLCSTCHREIEQAGRVTIV